MAPNLKMKYFILYACFLLASYVSAHSISRRSDDCPVSCENGIVEETQMEAERIWGLTISGSGSSICDGRSPKADVMMTAPMDACLRKAYICELDLLEAAAIDDCDVDVGDGVDGVNNDVDDDDGVDGVNNDDDDDVEESEAEDLSEALEDLSEDFQEDIPKAAVATATPSQHTVRKDAPDPALFENPSATDGVVTDPETQNIQPGSKLEKPNEEFVMSNVTQKAEKVASTLEASEEEVVPTTIVVQNTTADSSETSTPLMLNSLLAQ
ncbi:hypothetical protein SARC_03301 [Sphaeroforma arctica JP610]|uniref:SRCR domain-containing protein n=1 Tax=Sphaeroforma arctica JP610 TaxID=667725 RepID=A0A0L0G892_9EUKA|nr:hypothetical protein SARC_03301 [Sphaeroforma arctica JP610]KNC84468.1 hypothetical protein SARC_03301 [Sphaeroforma arctica JP610]|eukprot:XP_014158370.1 hypothetical protein SARC_03301 [Sphaeroforma arctica JP610]